MTTNVDVEKLSAQIKRLKLVYLILFLSSLAILAVQVNSHSFGGGTTIVWALALGGAVVTRVRRASLVRKYDELVWNRP
jgi:hypothetical protein